MDDFTTSLAGVPARKPRRLAARLLGWISSTFGWLMCSLATGAIAAFAALIAGLHSYWSILLLAVPLAVVLKLCGCLGRRWPGAAAALAVLLAAAYAECLDAVARIAQATGFPFWLAFRTGGMGLTLQVARLGLTALSIIAYACAAVLAAGIAAWMTHGHRGG